MLEAGRIVQRGAYAELAAADGPLRGMLERERAADLLAGLAKPRTGVGRRSVGADPAFFAAKPGTDPSAVGTGPVGRTTPHGYPGIAPAPGHDPLTCAETPRPAAARPGAAVRAHRYSCGADGHGVRRAGAASAEVARLYEDAAKATATYEAGRRAADAQRAAAGRLRGAA